MQLQLTKRKCVVLLLPVAVCCWLLHLHTKNIIIGSKTTYDHRPHDNNNRSFLVSPKSPQGRGHLTVRRASQLMDVHKMTVSQREKFQQAQVDRFCQHYSHNNWLMNGRNISTMNARQMLVNDKARTAYCYVPKAGCTTLKILFFKAQGTFKVRKDRKLLESDLEHNILKFSFLAKNETEREEVIKTYYKFMIYRNPVERLLSAYRDKVERLPLQGFSNYHPERNWLELRIYKYKHPIKFQKWNKTGGKTPVIISFPDFIDYWLDHGGVYIDEHFQPTFNLCRPCEVRYNYYGKFDTLVEDTHVLMKKVGRDGHIPGRSGHTNQVALSYYNRLSTEQKKRIINFLAVDLEFYYTIFPTERDKHKLLMGVNYDIPLG